MVSFLDRVIEGDALLVMRDIPSTSVDAVITDPPYSSGGLHYAQRMQNPITKYEQSSNKVVHHEGFIGGQSGSAVMVALVHSVDERMPPHIETKWLLPHVQ